MDTFALALGNRRWSPYSLNLSRDLPAAQRAVADIDATSPDLSAFAARGGRIIELHGWADPIVPAEDGIADYGSVMARQGPWSGPGASIACSLIPAMGHSGDPYPFDWFRPLVAWVEGDEAPDLILANHIPPRPARRRVPWCSNRSSECVRCAPTRMPRACRAARARCRSTGCACPQRCLDGQTDGSVRRRFGHGCGWGAAAVGSAAFDP